jgi:NADPH-dependent curcumin reductase CurA
MLVRNLYFSLEAAIRGWLDGKANYFEPIPLGGAIRGPSVAKVVASRLEGFHEGDIIFGLHHWEDYSLSDANTILLSKLDPAPDLPLSYYSGGLGGSGHTAYVGLHEIGKIQAGDTVVISAAAGATGSMATQIAKLRGCRVVGIVGGDDKAELITHQLGADAAINYKTCGDLAAAVMAACPEGVDVYFDNVGGKTLDALLSCMNTFGRIIGCGMISDYNDQDNPTPIYNMWKLVEKELTLKGFLLYTYMEQVPAASAQLHEWVRAGKITVLENITEGLPKAGWAYSEMMRGATIGKNLVAMDLEAGETI